MKKTKKKTCFPYVAENNGGRKAPTSKGASGTESGCVVSTPRSMFGCLKSILGWLRRIAAGIDILIELLKPRYSCYADIVILVRAVRYDSRLGIRSLPKAVKFIRFDVPPESSYYDRCIKARECVSDLAKKQADGEDKAWRSIAKMAQPNRRKKRRVRRNAAPGQYPIPHRSWANGVSSKSGWWDWNNSFP